MSNESNKLWNARNPDKVRKANREYMARFREAHPEVARARVRASQPSYYRRNKARYIAHGAAYDAAQVKRTPPWADPVETAKFYELAEFVTELSGEPWHVDHVIPLRGKKVSGLHVHTNLQVLPALVNVRKNNQFEVA